MMQQQLAYHRTLLLAIACMTFFSPGAKAGDDGAGQRISVVYSHVPLMKGIAFNPLMKLVVYVPAGKSISYTAIQLKLNAAAVAAIDKIEVMVRDEREKAFMAGAATYASVNTLSASLRIPLDLPLHQGWNAIWLGASLKSHADMDKQLSVALTAVTAASGFTYAFPRASQAAAGSYRVGIAIRKAGDDGVNTYRIPGITVTSSGTLVAVYDARYRNSGDLPGDIDIGMSRSTDGGRNWEPMKIIMDMGLPNENNGVGDPSILYDPVTRKIWVAALWSKGNHSIAGSRPGLSPDTTGQLVLTSSDDDGRSWRPPQNITAQVKNPAWHIYFQGPGNGIAMKNGTLVFPSQYWDETTKPSSTGIPYASIIYSQDHGRSWKSGTGAKSNTTESQVVETKPGTLMLNMRDNRGMFRSVATTTDMGKTWAEHPTSYSALPDPVCMAGFTKAMVKIKGQRKEVLFFSNVASKTTRHCTTIRASSDLGETWPQKNQLLLDERTGFGYSAIIQVDESTMGIIYEGERDVYFLRVPVKDIIQ